MADPKDPFTEPKPISQASSSSVTIVPAHTCGYSLSESSTCEHSCPLATVSFAAASSTTSSNDNVTLMATTEAGPTPRRKKHPVYRGIRCRSGKWVSEIREPKKTTRVWLGTYTTPEMAAAAYDVAALALKGREAVLNFPESVGSYPLPVSSSAAHIRMAAATAAATVGAEAAAAAANAAVKGGEKEVEEVAEVVGSSAMEFVDEEELLNMHGLLEEMAKGMMVAPPWIGSPPSDDSPENSQEESLWSY
ncbi:hypothetical protein F2Q70_00001552 [Brassica cretica]|uniref:AP2/ERF domain-containing protein n=1 Tax=Brassica cretica TaxID=69181 RepID=A0A3N6RRY3_BRACR|nr:hypothetical protein F2Q70_00001552 [Brassica cretica]KAF3567480.1 hypothetical protein DY000_02012546 [Brassica cretica]